MTDTTFVAPLPERRAPWNAIAAGLIVSIGASAVVPTLFAGLPFVAGLLSYIAASLLGRRMIPVDKTLIVWWAAFAVFLGIALSWAVYSEDSLHRSLKLCLLFGAALPLAALLKQMPCENRRMIQQCLPFILIIQGVFTVIEIYLDFPVHRFLGTEDEIIPRYTLNKNIAVFMVLLVPALYEIFRSRRYWWLAIVAPLIALMLYETTSQASQLALVVMAAAFLFYRLAKRYAVAISGIACLLCLIAAPFAAPYAFDTLAKKAAEKDTVMQEASAALRLENYDFISRAIMEKPWTGYGVDSTRNIEFDSGQIYYKSNRIMHPHNAFLQIWIEFGVAGMLFFGTFLAFMFRKLAAMHERRREVSFVMLAALSVFFMVSWSMWASWLIGLAFSVYALTIVFDEKDSDSHAQTS